MKKLGTLSEHNAHPTYRPDIDGLRAVAILSVVIFHVFPKNLRGGFAGVDIFFVISGFLISNIIFRSLQRGDFSFTEFYAHRIKRIFPALILVLAFSYAVGWFALLPDEFKQLGKHMAAGAGFVQNFVLWKEAGYFDTASETKPLMHLWSLAIEEQFYLIYPLLIWGAWRLRLSVILLVLLLGLLSFGLNVHDVGKDAVKTFFLPQTRFWELLAGSVLAYLQFIKRVKFAELLRRYVFHQVAFRHSPSAGKPDAAINNLLSTIGFLLIVASIFGLHRGKLFPGWWALVPVLGGVLLILAGPDAWVNRKILANRLMVFIGLISYPLYLWHWSLLSFIRIVSVETLSVGVRIGVVSLSFLLAWLTYLFLERPIRFGQKSWAKTTALCFLVFAVGLVGYNAFIRNDLNIRLKDRGGFSEYFDDSPPQFNYIKRNGLLEKNREDCNFYDIESWMAGHPTMEPRPFIDASCYTPQSNTSIFIWGDSHAQQLYHGLRTVLPQDISILQVASSGCSARFVKKDKSELEYCRKSNDFALKIIRDRVPQIVVIAQHSAHDKSNDLREITSFLKSIGVAGVIVLGPVPMWDPYLYKLIARDFWFNTPRRTFRNIDPDVFNSDRMLKAKYSNNEGGFQYISMIDFFCNQEGCLTYLGEDKREGLVTYDYGHLSPLASVKVAEKLLGPLILRDLNAH